MGTSIVNLISSHLDSSTLFPVIYSPMLSPDILDMYPLQHANVTSQNNIEKMYPIREVLNEDSNISNMKMPKKENIFQTVFNALTNMVGDHLSRVPMSFISNVNNPLSVIVVQNGDVISHDFFKSLTNEKKTVKEGKILETLYMDAVTNKIQIKECKKSPNQETNTKDINENQSTADCIIDKYHIDYEIKEEPSIASPAKDKTEERTNPNEHITVSSLLTNMWFKVMNSITDRFYYKTEAYESGMSSKRSYSPKQRKKFNTVAKGRGRGRAKFQLRRSGVSQTRHRKERVKHDLIDDIEEDFKIWQDFEIHHTVESHALRGDSCCPKEIVPHVSELVVHNSSSSMAFLFDDIKPTKWRPKTCPTVVEEIFTFPKKVRYIPDCTMDTNSIHQDYDKRYTFTNDLFRPRLTSESSVDSEDSYCIVFETGSESNYKNDFDLVDTSDEDQSNEDDIETPTQKVKFNLKPVVHTMVQWNYAYRAARRGPWEEMARDRERFSGRIHCLERVLNPVLTEQHRTRIWQERFAPDE